LPPYENSRYIGLQKIVFTDQFFHKNVPGEDEGERMKKEEKCSKKAKKKKWKRQQRRNRIKDVKKEGNEKQNKR
jgi:hypothetical protein